MLVKDHNGVDLTQRKTETSKVPKEMAWRAS